ncbi:hypothetical protein D5E86_25585 [Vibrio parahaemolyticus]|nr:hypothetical protein D5E86_25585 [Vibrio parahaemolyticus]
MSDFVLKLRAYSVAATLFDEDKGVENFANLYLALLKRERDEFEAKCLDEELLTSFMRRFAKEEPQLFKRIREALRSTEKRKISMIKAEQEQLLFFLFYMNTRGNENRPS